MPPSISSSEALVIWMLRIAMKAPIMHASTAIQSFMLARGGDVAKGTAEAVMLTLDMLKALPGGFSALAGAFRRFGEMAGGVVGRQQRESLAARRRETVDMAVIDAAGEHIDRDIDWLAAANVGELGFFEIGDDIGVRARHHRH